MEEKIYLHFDKDNKFWFSYDKKSNIVIDEDVANTVCSYTRKKNMRFVSKHYKGGFLHIQRKNFSDYFEEYTPKIKAIETNDQRRIRELEEELASLREMMTSVLDERRLK